MVRKSKSVDIFIRTMNENWFSYGEFKFSREQIVWALEHLQMLREGQWPPEHKETGYIGGKDKTINRRATFENPAIIASEIDSRLVCCGLDGLLLELAYASGEDDRIQIEQHIAFALGENINEIDRRVNRALKFLTGKRRKRRSYDQWRNHKGGKG